MADSQQLDQALRRYLRPGEGLVWTGRPKQGVMFSAQDIFLIPFSVLWCGFAIFWESAVLGLGFLGAARGEGGGIPIFMAFWGVPFVLVGLYMVFGRFFTDAWVRANTVYGLTGERALLLRRAFGETLLSSPLEAETRVKRHADGTGTLEFGSSFPFFGRGRGFGAWSPSLSSQVAFLHIQDFDRAYGLTARSR